MKPSKPGGGGHRPGSPDIDYQEMVSLTSSASSDNSSSSGGIVHLNIASNSKKTTLCTRRTKGLTLSNSAAANNADGNTLAALLGRSMNVKASGALLLGIMGFLTFIYVQAASSASVAIGRAGISPIAAPTHGSSFGGLYNIGQPAGARASSEIYTAGGIDALHDYHGVVIPASTTGHAVRSLSPQNIMNLRGHYVHDEHRSPYASHLYNRTKKELQAEQEAYVKKMDAVRKEWGAWDFHDPREDVFGPAGRPVTDFSKAHYKDLNAADFEEGSWQSDGEYVREFISEGKKLVDRMKEAIYAEYGYPKKKKDGTTMTADETKKRDVLFRVITRDYRVCRGGPVPIDMGFCGRNRETLPGIGYWQEEALDELSKKLLHAMMTNDEFYAVLGGHSSAAGHGNNFLQSKMMEFHYVMEPVFDRLGMRLISRNMAQGGVGTSMHAMAGADIYGESDFLVWDSSMTEGDAGAHDLFNRQAILSGERVPVILSDVMHNLEDFTDGTYKWGKGDTSASWEDTRSGFLPKTKDEEHAKTLPHAIRYLECEGDRRDLCNDHTYNSVCWVPRSDYNPGPDRKIDAFVGGRAKWHPGNLSHQLTARKWSLVVLYALDRALNTWSDGIDADGLPLAEKYWHVGKDYELIREKLKTHHVADKEEDKSDCEKLFSNFPIVCRVAMHGFTEWTPRVVPEEQSLRAILKPAPNGYYPFFDTEQEYEGIDILSPQWKIPDGDVDVHAVAIATTSPPPALDHSFSFDRSAGSINDNQGGGGRFLRSNQDTQYKISEEQKEAIRRLNAKLEQLPIDGELSPLLQSQSQSHRRTLEDGDDKIVTGQGWSYFGGKQGFCDGSAQSECGRSKTDSCPMSGHNDGRSGFFGDALSGWLVFEVPRVKEGIILVRMETWHKTDEQVERTEGWKEVNNGKTMDTTSFFDTQEREGDTKQKDDKKGDSRPDHRRLNIPENDFSFDYVINNGPINQKKTMGYEEFQKYNDNIVANFAVWPIMLDEKMAKEDHDDDYEGKTFEVAVKIRSKAKRDATVLISHIYYA